MYLNGMKLQDMVDVVPNRDWGPNTRVKPLRDLGIDIKPTQPKPVVLKPKPVKPVEQPKPVNLNLSQRLKHQSPLLKSNQQWWYQRHQQSLRSSLLYLLRGRQNLCVIA